MTSTLLAQLSQVRQEGPFDLTIVVLAVEEYDDLSRTEPPVRVVGEQAAVFAADVAGQSLQLPLVVVPDDAVATFELLDGGNELGRPTVRIEK